MVAAKKIGLSCVYSRGGGLPYKSDGDARLLTLGCKLQILVSLRVFGMESYYIYPFRYRLGLCLKKFTKNALTLTTQKWSPLGVEFEYSDEHPRHFYMGVPPGFLFCSHVGAFRGGMKTS